MDEEFEILKGLMADFPCQRMESVDSPEKAFAVIRFRFNTLDSDVFHSYFIRLLDETNAADFPNISYLMIKTCHEFLFGGIISNAGLFRGETDPNGGKILYGKINIRSPQALEFAGAHPSKIDTMVREACNLLVLKDSDPQRNSLMFYQRLMKIHPFYDGNGRVGRLVVIEYLRCCGFFINWVTLEQSKNKFIKLLNKCHRRENQDSFLEYFERLFIVWGKSILKIDA